MAEKREPPPPWEYFEQLDAVDGKEVHITMRESREDFDRRVRESIDRQHRRAKIAGS